MDPSQVAAYAAHFHSQPPPPPSLPSPPQQQPFSATYVHPSPAAAPAPAPSPSNPVPSHPSYTEMITAAIQWENSQGKEGGSSKRAIAKYIDRVYSNLPPSHSALLTHHLTRLKNSGQLVMIKNSYQLSSFSAPQPSPISAISQSPQQQFLPTLSTPLADQPSMSTKRKPGRPPKAKQPDFGPETVPIAKPESEVIGSDSLAGKKRRGRPAKVVLPFTQVEPEVGLDQVISSPSVRVSNGQVESSSVKRRGRPRKIQKQQEVDEMDEEVVVDRQSVFQVEVEETPVQPVNEVEVVKRGSGRPKKVVNYNDDDDDNENENDNVTRLVSDNVEKRKKRGWPAGRPRGKRVVAMAVSGVRRRGRKPKGSVGMVEKRVYSGKARGRPKKNSHGQEVANEELLRKLKEMQSKLRDAVGVLRPHVAAVSAPDALTALQQLEGLSTMNVTSSPALTDVVMDMPIDVTTAEAPPPSTSAP